MQVSKKQFELLSQAIDHWQSEALIDSEQASQLSACVDVIGFDWRKLAKYSFWLAIVSIIIAISSVLADQWLMDLLETLFYASDTLKTVAFTLISALLYFFALRRRKSQPDKTYSNEAIMFLGVCATSVAIAFLGKSFDTGSGHFSLLLLLATVIYSVLALSFPSKLIWVFSLLSLGSWMGAETGYASGWGAYYLGMNYPMRFVLFSLALIAVSNIVFKRFSSYQEFLRPTRIIALLYLFIALWIMSIFGNYGDGDHWLHAKQIELLHWSVLFAAAAIICIVHGIKYDDGMTRGFGLTFIFINLYTRFFEYFWQSSHKAIFFALLGLSFWYLGSRAEKIWQLNFLRKLNDKRRLITINQDDKDNPPP